MTGSTAAPASSNLASATPGIFNMRFLTSKFTFGQAAPAKSYGVKALAGQRSRFLKFGIWTLFGIWSLEFGAFPSPLSTLPLYFEAGAGPADAAPQFVARGRNYQFLLTPTRARLVLSKPIPGAVNSPRGRAELFLSNSTAARTVQMDFLGASPQAVIRGADELPGRINYLVGNDPTHWRSGVATYGAVQVKSLYNGIDLVYYGNQQRLEYDLTVYPSADHTGTVIHFES